MRSNQNLNKMMPKCKLITIVTRIIHISRLLKKKSNEPRLERLLEDDEFIPELR